MGAVCSKVTQGCAVGLLVITIAWPLFALPATLSLPRGVRPGVLPLSLPQAAQNLRATKKNGWDLIEAARTLVADRMQYCRRNSFDSYGRAFERGYGYCTQQAFALQRVLTQLGIENCQVVQSFHCRFPDGTVGSHAWVRVTYQFETKDIDTIYYNNSDDGSGSIAFQPLSEVTGMSRAFAALSWWGGTAVNAYRYYRTGKDL